MYDDERFSFYMALDGPHLDGLIGHAGILRFDWPERKYYIQYYDGISAGHNVSLSPDGKMALLGNFSQQILLLDIKKPDNMRVIARQATQYIEECPYRLRANTHHLWYPDNVHFIGVVGDHLYRFHIDRLSEPEQLGPHKLLNAHEIRWDSNRRYILIADLGPEDSDARQIAVFDLEDPNPEHRSKVIKLPGTVWHCSVHPDKPVGYAPTYTFATEQEDYVDWSPAYMREYIYEIDLPTAKVSRVWSCGAEFPVHLNSDVAVTSDNFLYLASGGSHTLVEINLDNFDQSRVLSCIPPFWMRTLLWRQRLKNFLGSQSRRPFLTNTHFILQTLQVTGWRILDGVYAGRVSPQGNYLVTGSRGYNVLSVYHRKTFKKLYSRLMPFRRDVYSQSPHYRLGWRGYHLGFHHSEVVSR